MRSTVRPTTPVRTARAAAGSPHSDDRAPSVFSRRDAGSLKTGLDRAHPDALAVIRMNQPERVQARECSIRRPALAEV